MSWFSWSLPYKAFLKTLYFLDKVGNKLTGGKEWETISSRMGKCLQNPKCKGKFIANKLCAMLNIIDMNHCIDAIEREMVDHGNVMMKSLGLRERE